MNSSSSSQELASIVVIFGISGDLAKRKVLPAIYHLIKDGLLPANSYIIGTSRKALKKDDLLKEVELCVIEENKVCDPNVIKQFKSILEVIKFDPVSESEYLALKAKLEGYEQSRGMCFNRLFYLSIPPQVFGPIVRLLGKSGLSGSCSHNRAQSRLLVEKPFGYNLKSAKDLITETGQYFREEQIFRIDHYLAKETAQNILAFRKYNPIFNQVWNNKLITGISIRALESIGIEGRVNFYDNVGALRDLIQSHLLQLLSLVTMELPQDITNSLQIHKAKLELLRSVQPPSVKNLNESVIRGQYYSYRNEVNNPRSNTETYVKLRLQVKNNRWSKVPVILETGKALAKKQTDIIISFIDPKIAYSVNQLTIRIQPNEGIDLKLQVKKPGFDEVIEEAPMDFNYIQAFKSNTHPDAYERVLIDTIRGDQSLFASSAEVIRSWQILEPILNAWQTSADDLIIYPNGSSGPKSW